MCSSYVDKYTFITTWKDRSITPALCKPHSRASCSHSRQPPPAPASPAGGPEDKNRKAGSQETWISLLASEGGGREGKEAENEERVHQSQEQGPDLIIKSGGFMS